MKYQPKQVKKKVKHDSTLGARELEKIKQQQAEILKKITKTPEKPAQKPSRSNSSPSRSSRPQSSYAPSVDDDAKLARQLQDELNAQSPPSNSNNPPASRTNSNSNHSNSNSRRTVSNPTSGRRARPSHPRPMPTLQQVYPGRFSMNFPPDMDPHFQMYSVPFAMMINPNAGLNNIDIDGMSYEELLAFESRQGAVKSKGAEVTAISRLPVSKFQSNSEGKNDAKVEDDSKKCSICLSGFESGDKIKTLPCFHHFHADEIDTWLQQDNSCPICKTKV
jgi:hypothetical protein